MFCIILKSQKKRKKKEWFKVLLPVCLFFFLKVVLQLWTRVGPHLGLTPRERQSKDPGEGWGWVQKRD